MSHKLSEIDAKRAANARAYAIGSPQRNGFHVRRIVWGRLMATAERRSGEQIKRAILWIEK